jgi:hypothetical protein
MIAIFLILTLVFLPVSLLVFGFKTAASIIGIFAIFSLPSIVQVLHSTVKSKSWPKIIGGPSVSMLANFNRRLP